MFNFSALPPLSLYIHIPWCARKCPYCDFNSHAQPDKLPEAAYIDALIRDLEHDLPRVWGRRVTSIFMGGGTPSLFSPEALDKLLCAVRARLTVNPDAEITLEANPGSSEYAKFKEFRAVGINRLSIGVQSFNEDMLRRLGRIHGRREAIAAAEAAHTAGFNNFNLDLMYGLPEQVLPQALDDLNTALALEPTHLSHYQLTLEPNTWFHRHPPALPDDDVSFEMQGQCQERLAERGFPHYEVSAYAQPGRACRHNVNYWEFGDYLGIGAGAHSKITDASQQGITRMWKQKQPQAYLNSAGNPACIGEETALSTNDAAFEFMLNALRLNGGFATHLFTERTGLPLSCIEQPLRQAEQRGLIECEASTIRPTEPGRRYLNDLTELFLPPG
ncbi:MAG: radical SAM family heme chaperone HemW [Gammaproteobacteria bacterium]